MLPTCCIVDSAPEAPLACWGSRLDSTVAVSGVMMSYSRALEQHPGREQRERAAAGRRRSRAPPAASTSAPSAGALGALVLAAGHAVLAIVVAGGGSLALLAPGMLLEGAGMGLIITPLTATVLSSLEPQRAGAASGALSTAQQVGNTIGVAVTGVIFFGALDEGFAHAFELSLVQLAAVCVAVAALTRLLPR